MSWIITKDFNPDLSRPEGTNSNAKGVIGPRSSPYTRETLTPDVYEQWPKFQMGDDDGNPYYEGHCDGKDDGGRTVHGFEVDADGETAPLDDFGMPNAGCTWIKYWDKEKNDWGESLV